MHLMISTVGGGGAMVSLHRWLSRDTRVAKRGQVSLEAADGAPGGMGPAFDVINAVFADAGAAAGIGSLLVAYRAWRETRAQPPSLRIERDGVSVVVNECSEREIQQDISVLLPHARGDDPADAPRADREG